MCVVCETANAHIFAVSAAVVIGREKPRCLWQFCPTRSLRSRVCRLHGNLSKLWTSYNTLCRIFHVGGTHQQPLAPTPLIVWAQLNCCPAFCCRAAVNSVIWNLDWVEFFVVVGVCVCDCGFPSRQNSRMLAAHRFNVVLLVACRRYIVVVL